MSACMLVNLLHSKLAKNEFEGAECLLLLQNMTWLSFILSFTKAPNYSTLNLAYFKGR